MEYLSLFSQEAKEEQQKDAAEAGGLFFPIFNDKRE